VPLLDRVQKHLIFLPGVCGMTLILCLQPALLAEQTSTVSVPFVGCESDGQTGAVAPLKGSSRSVRVDTKGGQDLAYYKSAMLEFGVLAPRGWYCFGTFGSGGEALFVSPQPLGGTEVFSDGWAVVLNRRLGDTIGRFDVAEVIERVFPSYKRFVDDVMFDVPKGSIRYGPYRKDTLSYKGKSVVEYKTPAQTEGLGSHYPSLLKKNSSPIEGVAILIGPAQKPDLLLLSVRLPPDLTGLTSVIIRQTERDALHIQ